MTTTMRKHWITIHHACAKLSCRCYVKALGFDSWRLALFFPSLRIQPNSESLVLLDRVRLSAIDNPVVPGSPYQCVPGRHQRRPPRACRHRPPPPRFALSGYWPSPPAPDPYDGSTGAICRPMLSPTREPEGPLRIRSRDAHNARSSAPACVLGAYRSSGGFRRGREPGTQRNAASHEFVLRRAQPGHECGARASGDR